MSAAAAHRADLPEKIRRRESRLRGGTAATAAARSCGRPSSRSRARPTSRRSSPSGLRSRVRRWRRSSLLARSRWWGPGDDAVSIGGRVWSNLTGSGYLARAAVAGRLGDTDAAAGWTADAASLKRAFNDRFWLLERGYYAVALDRAEPPVDAPTSNLGQRRRVTGLTGGDRKHQRPAPPVHQGVSLRGQPAAGAAKGVIARFVPLPVRILVIRWRPPVCKVTDDADAARRSPHAGAAGRWSSPPSSASRSPAASASATRSASTRSQVPSLLNRLCRFHTVCHGPNSSGRSRHGGPVRAR